MGSKRRKRNEARKNRPSRRREAELALLNAQPCSKLAVAKTMERYRD